MSDYAEQYYTNRLAYPDYDLYKDQRGMTMNLNYQPKWTHPLSTNSWSRGARSPSTPATTYASSWGNRGKCEGELPILPPIRSFGSTWGSGGHSACYEPSFAYGSTSFNPVRPQTPNHTSYEPVRPFLFLYENAVVFICSLIQQLVVWAGVVSFYTNNSIIPHTHTKLTTFIQNYTHTHNPHHIYTYIHIHTHARAHAHTHH